MRDSEACVKRVLLCFCDGEVVPPIKAVYSVYCCTSMIGNTSNTLGLDSVHSNAVRSHHFGEMPLLAMAEAALSCLDRFSKMALEPPNPLDRWRSWVHIVQHPQNDFKMQAKNEVKNNVESLQFKLNHGVSH